MKLKHFGGTLLTGLTLIFAPQMAETATADLHAEGLWSFSFHGGIAPCFFNENLKLTTAVADVRPGPITVPSGGNELSQANLVKRTKALKFKDYYDAPGRFGMDVGYFMMKNTEVLFGVDLYVMSGKRFTAFDQNLNGSRFEITGRAKARDRLAVFAGLRHFFDCNSCVTPFIGMKVGTVAHLKTKKTRHECLHMTVVNGQSSLGVQSYGVRSTRSLMGLYGGLQVGAEMPLAFADMGECASVFISAEAVGLGATEYDLAVTKVGKTGSAFKATHEIVHAPRSMLAMPLSFGLRFRF